MPLPTLQMAAVAIVTTFAACSYDMDALRGAGDAGDDARSLFDGGADSNSDTAPLMLPKDGGSGATGGVVGTGGTGGAVAMGGAPGTGGIVVQPPPPLPSCAAGDCTIAAYGGHHYLFSYTRADWTTARKSCTSRKGYLAVITDEGENAFVDGFASPLVRANINSDANSTVLWGVHPGFWLGGSDEDLDGVWQWVTPEPFTYTNWAPGAPDRFGGAEIALIARVAQDAANPTRWNDSLAGHLAYPLCEFPF